MAHWQKELAEIVAGSMSLPLPGGFKEIVGAALEEFGEELRKHGRTVSIEIRKEEIGVSVRTDGGLEFEGVIAFRDGVTVTLFSNEAIISNFRLRPKTLPAKEDVIRGLVHVFAAVRSTPEFSRLLSEARF